MRESTKSMAVRDLIAKLSKRPGGMRLTEIPSTMLAGSHVHAISRKMIGEGVLHRAQVSHKVVAYFDTKERADAHLEKHGRRPGTPSVTISKARAWDANTPAIETPQTKYTYGPHYTGRVLRTNTHGVIG